MFTRHSLRKVQYRPTTSLFFTVIIVYILGKQKSNIILKNLFYMDIKFDELLSEIDNVW